VLNERTTYEIMDPAAVGQGESKLVLGKHSGRAAFRDALQKLGHDIHGDALNSAFTRFKELADRKVQLNDADLEALAIEEIGGSVQHAYEFVSLEVRGGTASTPTADLVMRVEGEEVAVTCEGDGMVDASCSAVKLATGAEGRMTDYNVTSVTGGVDALADVALTFEGSDGVKVSGRGLSTDVVEASARAFIGALNKIARIRASGEDPNAVDRPGHIG
jgi:2-isopropylmalate synthase